METLRHLLERQPLLFFTAFLVLSALIVFLHQRRVRRKHEVEAVPEEVHHADTEERITRQRYIGLYGTEAIETMEVVDGMLIDLKPEAEKVVHNDAVGDKQVVTVELPASRKETSVSPVDTAPVNVVKPVKAPINTVEEQPATAIVKPRQPPTIIKVPAESITSLPVNRKQEPIAPEFVTPRIVYTPHDLFFQQPVTHYPVVRMPKPLSVIRSPRKGRRIQRRGHLERAFERRIAKWLSECAVEGDRIFPTSAGGRPYEPDILVSLASWGLHIDVEVDEPYQARWRQPLHVAGTDDLRDAYFTDRGIIICRFSEKQVATETDNCVAYIARLIASINGDFKVPLQLQKLNDPSPDPVWTAVLARLWAQQNYRESYLNIESFGDVEVDENEQGQVLTEDEERIERQVEQSVAAHFVTEKFETNRRNGHERDNHLQFVGSTHEYFIRNTPAISVTTLIERYFSPFDAEANARRKATEYKSAQEWIDEWKRVGDEAAALGERLHRAIEKQFHKEAHDDNSPEFEQFQKFYQAHVHLDVYRTEWRIYDDVNGVAGTVDMVVRNSDGTFDIYDWKRSRKVVFPGGILNTQNWGRFGLFCLERVADTSYDRYSVQMHAYKCILERFYDMRISNMYLLVMHPDLDNYYKLQPADHEESARQLLAWR